MMVKRQRDVIPDHKIKLFVSLTHSQCSPWTQILSGLFVEAPSISQFLGFTLFSPPGVPSLPFAIESWVFRGILFLLTSVSTSLLSVIAFCLLVGSLSSPVT